jgi:tetratricopeptide (TPR) repeat protein
MSKNVMEHKSALPSILLLFGICMGVLFAYTEGLNGSFIFDDFQTLEALGDFNGVRNWSTFLLYLDSGHAGPTGRPISMLSFLLNATNWPAEPYYFKLTNLLIHLLCGILLAVVSYRLLSVSVPDLSARNRSLAAVMAAAWWLLNPLHVSTTLYIVQRMTQLAALFSLLGLLSYLYGRTILANSKKTGYSWMTLAVCMGVLATLSKENGALLPLLILLMEILLLRPRTTTALNRYWSLLFLWVPALIVISYLAWTGYQLSGAGIPSRNFSVLERLLTESRILWQYLYNLLIPRLDGGSFFGDDILVSQSLFSPLLTLFAILALIATVIFCWLNKARYPLLAFSILFFLAGHLIESTTIPLELYFEHRNYLPSLFLALPLSVAATRLLPTKPFPVISGALLILLLLGGMTWQRSSLWGDTEKLYIYWAFQSPNSARAQTAAIGAYTRMGRKDLAFSLASHAVANNPDKLLLQLQWLSFFPLHSLEQEEVKVVLNTAHAAEYEVQALAAMSRIVEECESKHCSPVETMVVRAIVDKLLNNYHYARQTGSVRLLQHLKGRLYLIDNNIEAAIDCFSRVPSDANFPEIGLLQTSILASKGYYQEALSQLQRVKITVRTYNLPKMKKEYYLRETDRLEQILQQDLRETSHSNHRMGSS